MFLERNVLVHKRKYIEAVTKDQAARAPEIAPMFSNPERGCTHSLLHSHVPPHQGVSEHPELPQPAAPALHHWQEHSQLQGLQLQCLSGHDKASHQNSHPNVTKAQLQSIAKSQVSLRIKKEKKIEKRRWQSIWWRMHQSHVSGNSSSCWKRLKGNSMSLNSCREARRCFTTSRVKFWE